MAEGSLWGGNDADTNAIILYPYSLYRQIPFHNCLHSEDASALTRQTRDAEISKTWPIMYCSAHNSDSRSRRVRGLLGSIIDPGEANAWQSLIAVHPPLPVGPPNRFPQWPHRGVDGASGGFTRLPNRCLTCVYCKGDWISYGIGQGDSLLWLR